MIKEPKDFLPDQPVLCIDEVWNDFDLEYLMDDEMPYWFLMAVSTEVFEDNEDRRQFVEFFYDFMEYLEAIYFFSLSRSTRMKRKLAARRKIGDGDLLKGNLPRRLTAKDVARPKVVITGFCQRYVLAYAKKELSNCFESVILYEGRFKEMTFKGNIFRLYSSLDCLLEAGYLL
jgi:hypothetical protein